MNSTIAIAFLLAPLLSDSVQKYWEECAFVYGYSVFAYKMAAHEGVPEERFHIEDGDEASEMKKAIRHDVYHDLKSLRERVERACAEKAQT